MVAAPFTAPDLARAIRWAREWYVHEKGAKSLQSRMGAFLIERAARDFEEATRGEVERSVFTPTLLRDTLGLEYLHGEDQLTSTARDLAESFEKFRHYYRLHKQWYEFVFVGPSARARGVTVQPVGNPADYYLVVQYRRVSIREVPDDRRHHRPGHLERSRGFAISALDGFRSTMPTPASEFMGRAVELRRFLRLFARGRNRTVIAAVEGLPGVGKTEFVAAASVALLTRYVDAHLYISAGSESEPRAAEDLFRDALDVLETDPSRARPTELAGLAARYRALLQGRSCLIVCENVTVLDRVALLAPPAGSALIVSSRGPLAMPGVPGFVLQPFTHTNARAFVTGLAGQTTHHPSNELVLAVARALHPHKLRDDVGTVADLLVALCGNLPLALRICGRYLALHADVDVERFTAYFADERRRLALTSAKEETLSVEASLNLTFTRLETREQRAFALLGVFPGSFAVHAGELVLGDLEGPDDHLPHGVASELVRYGLLRWDGVLRRYSMHELLRAFARTHLSRDERSVAMNRLVMFIHTLGAHHLRAYTAGHVEEQYETETLISEDLPTLIVAADELLARAESSIDALYACSDIVLGFSPALLRRDAPLLRVWSGRLLDLLQPLAAEAYQHERLPQHDAKDLRASPTWGDARSRWAEHTFYAAIAAEETGDDATALVLHRSMYEQTPFPIAGDRQPGLFFRCRERAIRILRRRDTAPSVMVESIRELLRDRPQLDPIEAVLHVMVYADALERNAETEVADTVVRGLLRNWKEIDVPWAAALYLDALAETPSAWVQASMRYAARSATDPPSGLVGVYTHRVAATFERHGLLADVAAHLATLHNGARARLPIAIGRVLGRIRRRAALRFYAEAVRVAEATSDPGALGATLIARADTNEASGEHRRALEDVERVQQLALVDASFDATTRIERLRDIVQSRSSLKKPPTQKERRRK